MTQESPSKFFPTASGISGRVPRRTHITRDGVLVFGNADHIQLVRLRRSKANAKRAVKKPRVQVEIKEIPAMIAEEQLPKKATSNKKTTYDQGQTLWDFLAQEPFPEPIPKRVVSPVLVVEPQQLTLF